VKKSKILLVDDNSKIQYAFQSFLEKEGYISLSASDGSNVLNIIARENPSLVFLDISLPDQNGLDILKQIKKDYPSLPVIIVSGYISDENRKRAKDFGALDFLEKPLSLAKIRKILN
jgi:two-component system nitrogen regulation response regulator NtrX